MIAAIVKTSELRALTAEADITCEYRADSKVLARGTADRGLFRCYVHTCGMVDVSESFIVIIHRNVENSANLSDLIVSRAILS